MKIKLLIKNQEDMEDKKEERKGPRLWVEDTRTERLEEAEEERGDLLLWSICPTKRKKWWKSKRLRLPSNP